MAQHAARLLLDQNWSEIARLFEQRQPHDGDEYCVRALLNLYRGNGTPDWPGVLGDLRQACARKPSDPLLLCNLSQALLDSGHTEEAYTAAQATCSTYPNSLPALEKHVLAAVATRRWAQAHGALVHAKNLLGHKQRMPDWAANLLAELSCQWWVPLQAAGVQLRIPDASDEAFLKDTFRDAAFMQHYHRFQGSSDEAVTSFIANAKLSPRQSGRLDWIILDRNQERVGLFAFVDIDWRNQRGEILIGLPGDRAPTLALKASVTAMAFAFDRLGLQKIVSYVYADNPQAQANTLHLGFVQEGLLRSHISGGDAGRLDIFVNGMTPADLASNSFVSGLARRWVQKPFGHANVTASAESSQSQNADFGTGGNIRALVTFTPTNGGAYYLGVQDFSTAA